MEEFKKADNGIKGNYDGSESFVDVSSKEMFVLGLPRIIKNEEDKDKVIRALRKYDYQTNGERKDYFTGLEEEVKKFEIN